MYQPHFNTMVCGELIGVNFLVLDTFSYDDLWRINWGEFFVLGTFSPDDLWPINRDVFFGVGHTSIP